MIRFVALLVMLAGPAAAQERVAPADFLARLTGKTAEFYSWRTGVLVGTEHFFSSKLSAWRRAGRGCVYGRITIENGAVCFAYPPPERPSKACWWPMQIEGELFVVATDLRRNSTQRVVFTDKELGCEEPSIS